VDHELLQTPLLAFKSRSLQWLAASMKKPSAQTLGTTEIVMLVSGLRDTYDRRFLKQEDLTGLKTELNISVLTPLPLSMASGNELSNIFHHQRFHRIGMYRRRDSDGSGVGTVKGPAALLVVG
jgi:hypothetical protein